MKFSIIITLVVPLFFFELWHGLFSDEAGTEKLSVVCKQKLPRIHAKLNAYLAVYSKKLLLTFDSLKTAPVEISDSIKITTISDEILNKIANIGKIEIKKATAEENNKY